MKNNGYPKYFKNKGNDIYASYDGIFWFWYANLECCQKARLSNMKWNIVHECDNDNEEPTQWACKLTEDGRFVWIDKIGECAYGITNKASGDDYLYVAGSLQGAKRWVSTNLIKVLQESEVE